MSQCHPHELVAIPGAAGRTTTWFLVFLLGHLLNHLASSRSHRVGEYLTGRSLHHFRRHTDAVAVAVAGPADKDGVGAPNAVFARLHALFADSGEALAVGFAGLLFEQLVDCFLLLSGQWESVSVAT